MNLLSNVTQGLYQFVTENLPDLDPEIRLISSVALGALGVGAFLYYATCDRFIPSPNSRSNTDLQKRVHFGSQLTTIDLSNDTKTEALDLSNNLLTDVDIFNNTKLKSLDISRNHLMVINFIGGKKLERLFLAENQLPTIDLSQLTHLKWLNLTGNQLPTIDLSHNPELESLSLLSNRLNVCPDFSNNLRLESLNLSCNRLTSLHESIFSLPRTCYVDVTANQFTPEYMAGFMAHLEQHRALHPEQGPNVVFSVYDSHVTENVPLEEQIEEWSKEFAEAFAEDKSLRPDKSQLQPNNLEEQQLAVFLKRLRELKDYSLGGETRKNVILRVENMLQLACKNLEFRKAMFLVLNQATETCGDRVLLCFNDIEILYQFHSKELTDDKFKELALSEGRYEVLRKDALEIYDQNGGDDVEIILAYHVDLREALKLPISTKYMKYRALANVTDEMLSEAKAKVEGLSDVEILVHSPQWLTKMRKLYPEKVENISEEFEQLIEFTGQYFDLEGEAVRKGFLEKNVKLAHFINSTPAPNHPAVVKVIADARDKEIACLEKA